MKLGTEDKKKLIIAGVGGFFAIFCTYFLYQDFFGGPDTPPPAPAVVVVNNTPGAARTTGSEAPKIATTSGQLDPTLHMDAMLVTEGLVYSGSGRNIFAGGAYVPPAATVIKAISPPRPITTTPTVVQVVNPGPAPLPPINLKFFGTSTSAAGVRRAFLVQGDDVFLAAAGDVVQRKYRVVSISPSTILIEDIPNTNKQTLPLIPN